MAETLAITERTNSVRFAVRVIPRARRSTIEGVHGGALKVRLTAPPVDGSANEELVEVLADALGVPRSRVQIAGGARSRSKVVEVTGVTGEGVRRAIGQSTNRLVD